MQLVFHASSRTCNPTRCTHLYPFIPPQLSLLHHHYHHFPMADRPQPHQLQVHPQQQYGGKPLHTQRGPTTSQILAIVTLLPVTGTLLGLAGITLIGTLIGLAVAAPLFVIFSPILVPAVILIGGVTTAFFTSGAFGLTGLSSLSWVLNSFRQSTGKEPLDYAKQRVQEATIQVGEKTKQVGETIKSKAQEGGRETTGRT